MESTSIHNQITQEIERLSHGNLGGLKLPPELEDRVEQSIGPRRAMHLWYQGLVAIVLFDLFAIVDYFIGDGASWQTVFLRAGIVTPLALFVNAGMRWNPGKVYREASVAFVICVAALTHLYIESGKGVASSAYAQAGIILAVLFANVVLRLRFSYAALTSAVLLAGDLVYLHLNQALSPTDKTMGLILTVC